GGWRQTADQSARGKIQMSATDERHEQWAVLQSITLMIGIAVEACVLGQPETYGQVEADGVVAGPRPVQRYISSRCAGGGVVSVDQHRDVSAGPDGMRSRIFNGIGLPAESFRETFVSSGN